MECIAYPTLGDIREAREAAQAELEAVLQDDGTPKIGERLTSEATGQQVAVGPYGVLYGWGTPDVEYGLAAMLTGEDGSRWAYPLDRLLADLTTREGEAGPRLRRGTT